MKKAGGRGRQTEEKTERKNGREGRKEKRKKIGKKVGYIYTKECSHLLRRRQFLLY